MSVVSRAWHIYLCGLDSGFNYYGGLGNDDEVKQALATRRAIELLQSNEELSRSFTLQCQIPSLLACALGESRFPRTHFAQYWRGLHAERNRMASSITGLS